MKAKVGRPDALPPGFRWLAYWGFCWMNRHPEVWRFIGAGLRRWPALSHVLPFAARRSAVQQVLTRPKSFSNTSHAANLVASDFLIGMDPGVTYDADRALFASILGSLKVSVSTHADQEAQRRIKLIRGSVGFDLIDDYLMWVVLSAIKLAFGPAFDGIVAGSRTVQPDEATQRNYLREIRHVAAHLFAGWLAPQAVAQRAEVSAASLRSRIEKMIPVLQGAWSAAGSMPNEAIRRNAIGLAWVSHPVTAQSGALAFQELLGRPGVYEELRKKAHALKDNVWTDTDFRKDVSDHVLELMRFRPVFPLLAREVPRATQYEAGARKNAKCPAGSSLTVLSIAASFDAHQRENIGEYCPGQLNKKDPEMKFMMFGYSKRRCPAKDHAVDMLTSAFIGLLTLPELRWADPWGSRIVYDGPMISRMRLRIAP